MGPLQYTALPRLCEITANCCERLIRRFQDSLLLAPGIMRVTCGYHIMRRQGSIYTDQFFTPARLTLRTDDIVRGAIAVRQREVSIQEKYRIRDRKSVE